MSDAATLPTTPTTPDVEAPTPVPSVSLTAEVETKAKARLVEIEALLKGARDLRDQTVAKIKILVAEKNECERVIAALKPKTRKPKDKGGAIAPVVPPVTKEDS